VKGDLVCAPISVREKQVMTLGIYDGIDERTKGHKIINLLPQSREPKHKFAIVKGLEEDYGTPQEQYRCIYKATPMDVLLLNTMKSLNLLAGERHADYSISDCASYSNYSQLRHNRMQDQGPVVVGAAEPEPETVLAQSVVNATPAQLVTASAPPKYGYTELVYGREGSPKKETPRSPGSRGKINRKKSKKTKQRKHKRKSKRK